MLTIVELDELVQRVGLRVGVLQHPEQMFEEDDLAGDVDGVVVGVAGPLHQLPEDRVVDDVGADEVAPSGFPDVDGVVVVRAGDGGGFDVVVGGDSADAAAGAALLVVAE